ncbi:MAG: VOC family protein [Polyangiaceae bacterium]
MKPSPKNWPRISSSLYYQDAAQAIDWLCTAFGFAVRLKIENDQGRIEHSELEYGEGLIMVGDTSIAGKPGFRKSPRAVSGGNTQNMMVFVDDADAHCAHAREHGAKIVVEPHTDDYGDEYWSDRSYEAEDPEGHHWWFCTRVKEGAKSSARAGD